MAKKTALSGSLEFLNLGELMQLLGSNNSSGTLRLHCPYAPEPAYIYFKQGNPVNGQNGSLAGVDALFSLFGWMEGEFEFTAGDPPVDRTIEKSRMEIILDGLRMLDDGEIKKVGPSTAAKPAAGSAGAGASGGPPVVRGPFVDYMLVVDEEEYYEGDEIFHEGNFGNWMWVVLEGTISMMKETPKGRLPIYRITDGAFVGGLSSFLSDGGVRHASAVTESRVQLGMLDSQRLANEFAGFSADFKLLVKSLEKRQREVSDRAVEVFLGKDNLQGFIEGMKLIPEQGLKEGKVVFLTQGTAAVVRKSEKGGIPLVSLGKGDFFGTLPFLDIGHEPGSAAVFASPDIKVTSVAAAELQKEYEKLSATFKNILDNTATSVSVTTMVVNALKKKMAK